MSILKSNEFEMMGLVIGCECDGQGVKDLSSVSCIDKIKEKSIL